MPIKNQLVKKLYLNEHSTVIFKLLPTEPLVT
jgi:hypothetical protein